VRSSNALQRMEIRPISIDDAEAIQALAADPAIAATSNVPHPYPANGGKEFVHSSLRAAAEGSEAVFAVLADGQFVGVCSLLAIDRRSSTASLGYWIGVPYWGRGYATAAVAEVVQYASSRLRLSRLIAESLAHNLASRRVVESNGFRLLGECAYHGPWPERFGSETCLCYERVEAQQ
jgi:RimJ/RimL family protein N-acetyltransferase